jgi:hypothetical protein
MNIAGRFVVASVVAVACTTPAILTPDKTGPNTAWPCGYQGQSCGNHMCCLDTVEDCGGITPGCPAGMCCASGGNTYVGTSLPTHQWAEPRVQ